MAIVHVTTAEEINAQVATNKMVVLNFWATWCGPCRMFANVLEQIDEEMEDVRVLKVNVDEHPELSEKFEVMGIPHTRVILNNAMYEPLVGYIPYEQLQPMLETELKEEA
ncbi:thioredoxin family protein [Kurthia senegalensis]|uniref:thioredoxin family protein n=1 Tax=Kurthia senegalensis TaxID=1033740 RepID=UPI000288D87F|nr:thioredoxin family protein [Kurthia senegalensis]